MTRPRRFTLPARFIAGLLASLLVSAALLLVWLPLRLGLDGGLLLTQAARERLQTTADRLAGEVAPALGHEAHVPLTRYELLYGIGLAIYDGDGSLLAGEAQPLPRRITQQLEKTRLLLASDAPCPLATEFPQCRAAQRPAAPVLLPAWPAPERAALIRLQFAAQEPGGSRRWLGVRTAIEVAGGQLPATVLLTAPNLWALARFLGIGEWLRGVGLVSGLVLLAWLPLLWSATAMLARISHAAERIAAGQLDLRLNSRRGDELGRLAHAVDGVAAQLDSYVRGQRNFLSNIAHEVASPLGRLQLALELLEQKLAAPQQEVFDDVREEVELMAELIAELLAFSRAELGGPPQLVPLSLKALVISVIERENAVGRASVSIPPELTVKAHGLTLARAIGNLVRNALRYAGTERGPIEIEASGDSKTVTIRVSDYGPGVPELALLKLGDPFFRPELSRSRSTGGIGLGLATVRNCVAACRGRVTFSNRPEGGFRAEIVLSRGE